MYIIKKYVKIAGPYDFELSVKLTISEEGKDTTYDHNLLSPIKINDKPAIMLIKNIGVTNDPKLRISIVSKKKFNKDDIIVLDDMIKKIIENIDLKKFYHTVKDDPIMRSITKQLYGMKHIKLTDYFHAFICAICEQQLTMKVAIGIENKIAEKFGDEIVFNNNIYYAFPTATDIYKKASVTKLRHCGMSTNKAKAIYNLAKLIVKDKIKLEDFEKYNGQEFVDKLIEIKGIETMECKIYWCSWI